MTYYVFLNNKERVFCRVRTLDLALRIAKDWNSVVYRKAEGIPNPWYVQEYLGKRGQYGPVKYIG